MNLKSRMAALEAKSIARHQKPMLVLDDAMTEVEVDGEVLIRHIDENADCFFRRTEEVADEQKIIRIITAHPIPTSLVKD